MAKKTTHGSLTWMVIASIIAHAVVGGVLIYNVSQNRPKVTLPENVLVTKLVRLGKKRPEKLLPVLEEPPAAELAPPTPPSPVTKPAVQPAPPKAKDRIQEISRVSGALDRLKKTNIGSEEGSTAGEVSNLALQVLGNQFATEVSRCMKQHYTIEGADRTQVANLRTTVTIKVQADGRIISVDVVKSSGSPRFDQSVVRSAKRCNGVKPYPAIAETVRKEGLDVEFIGGELQ